jgi:hypothetical protein
MLMTISVLSVDFFGALRARAYDDEVRKWISGVGVENVGKRLVNSKEGPPVRKLPLLWQIPHSHLVDSGA